MELTRQETEFLGDAIRHGKRGGSMPSLLDKGLIQSENKREQRSYGLTSWTESTITEAGKSAYDEQWVGKVRCGDGCRNLDQKFECDGRCLFCGGEPVAGAIVKTCRTCGEKTDHLEGLFVPHACKSCADKARERDRQSGRVCRRCNDPYFDCCC